jgi:hypothetical protein
MGERTLAFKQKQKEFKRAGNVLRHARERLRRAECRHKERLQELNAALAEAQMQWEVAVTNKDRLSDELDKLR